MTHQDMTNDEGVIDIPVRIQEQRTQTAEQIRRLEDQQRETEDMIHQYERKYGYVRYEDAGEAPHQAAREVGMTDKKKKNDGWFSDLRENMPPRHRYPTPAVKANVLSENEENWAFIAHASALLTLVMALSTGPGVLLALLIPLGIYFFHRNKSQFVAFHALQAFTLQVSCTIGVMLLAVVGGLLTALP